MSTITYAILPYKEEFCVAHLGTAKVWDSKLFQTVWVVDAICPTMELAIAAQSDFVKAARVRAASTQADLRSLDRRNG